MGAEQDMDMILIRIPLLQCDMVVRSDVFEDLPCPFRDLIIQDFPSVFDRQNQMVIEQEY